MRLIDADRVMQSIDMQMIIARELLSNKPQSQELVSIAEQSFKQEISNAPTVNAIPIEWLDRYVCNITQEEKLIIDKMFIKWAGEENETN